MDASGQSSSTSMKQKRSIVAKMKLQEDNEELDNFNSEILQKRNLEHHIHDIFAPAYDGVIGPIEDFDEMMVTFGFTVLFVPALPGVMLLAYLTSCLELKSDAFKFLHIYQST